MQLTVLYSSTVSNEKTPEHPELSCSCCHQNAKIFSHYSCSEISTLSLKINERIKYKLFSLTYKVLTTKQPNISTTWLLFNPVTTHILRHSMVTLVRPPTRPSLKIANRSFRYAAPCPWNELPTDLREPRQTQSPSLSPITHGSSSSSPSSLSPLASSLTRSVFHSELKTWLFRQIISSIDLFLSYRTDSTDSRTI